MDGTVDFTADMMSLTLESKLSAVASTFLEYVRGVLTWMSLLATPMTSLKLGWPSTLKETPVCATQLTTASSKAA